MRQAPSIVPSDRLDRDVYLVLEDFGARAGCAWRETDEADTDRETVLRDILLALQLQFSFEMGFARVGLMSPAPGRPCEDVGVRDAPLS
jgi:hypothetical protein